MALSRVGEDSERSYCEWRMNIPVLMQWPTGVGLGDREIGLAKALRFNQFLRLIPIQ